MYSVLGAAVSMGGLFGSSLSGLNTAGADWIIAGITQESGVFSPSDSEGNTWNGLSLVNTTSKTQLFVASSPVLTSAAHDFYIGQYFGCIAVIWGTGSLGGSFVDGDVGAASNSPGTITPTEDNELLVSIVSGLNWAGQPTPTIDSGFTFAGVSAAFADHGNLAIAYKIQTGAGSESPIWTSSDIFGRTATCLASFKAASVGGQVPPLSPQSLLY